ncbi:MAG: molybdopterin-containing oxidoreductase family protein [Geminicoccaceae bacterium]
MTQELLPSVCPHDCPSACALDVERLADGRLGKVRGSERNANTAGVICAKVARYAERFHHPDRLGQPLQRIGEKGTASFVPISWDDALDSVAEAFLKATARHGSEAVWPYFYAGTMGLVQRDGIQRLRHAMGYSGWHATICTTLSEIGWRAGYGKCWGTEAPEMITSDLVVIWGGNPVSTQVNVMTHVARARKQNGAKLVVVDPYRTGTAAQADIHLALRPGTDGALACAVMHILFRDGWADRDYLAANADDVAELEAHLETRTPAWAAGITGLSVEAIENFAALYGRTERSYIRFGYGFTRSRNGAAAMHAASALPIVTGAWQHPGGGALYSQRDLYNWDKTLIEGLDLVDPSIRVLDQSRIGPILTGDKRDLGDGPPVTALLIQNTNPMDVAPDLTKVHRGFARDDLFVCVHEQFMTETAKMADIVLPATMFLEHDDIYQAGGHTSIQIGRQLFEPFAACRTNHYVICELAKRLGAPAHPGFEMTEWQLIDDLLQRSGWADAATVDQAGGWEAMPDVETAHYRNGFPTPNGRFQFAPDWKSLGPDHAVMPKLPDHMEAIDRSDDERPFRLVTAPARQFLNTSFTEMPSSIKREGRPTALIHPDDAREHGVDAGDVVRLGNELGSVALHADSADGQQRGVIIVETIWPNHAFIEGIGINALTSADPGPPNGGAVFHDTAVWLRAEPAGGAGSTEQGVLETMTHEEVEMSEPALT